MPKVAHPNAPDLAWPLASGTPGIEVWYALAGPADGSFAFWFRYTLLSTQSGHQEARLWAAATLRDAPERSFLVTRRFPLATAKLSDAPFRLTIKEGGALWNEGASGRVGSPEGLVEWSFEWVPDEVVWTPVGSPAVTAVASRLFGTSRHRSVQESIRVTGTLSLGERQIRWDGVPGHQGHTSGRRLVGRWAWLQCNAFPDPTVSVEVLSVANLCSLCLRAGGRTWHLNRMPHLVGPRANTAEQSLGHFVARGRDRDVELEVAAHVDDPACWQRAVYLSPDDTKRFNAHCSLTRVDLRWRVREGRGFGPWQEASSSAGRAEWVASEPLLEGRYFPDDFKAEFSGGGHG